MKLGNSVKPFFVRKMEKKNYSTSNKNNVISQSEILIKV